jgi:hypothetical protein
METRAGDSRAGCWNRHQKPSTRLGPDEIGALASERSPKRASVVPPGQDQEGYHLWETGRLGTASPVLGGVPWCIRDQINDAAAGPARLASLGPLWPKGTMRSRGEVAAADASLRWKSSGSRARAGKGGGSSRDGNRQTHRGIDGDDDNSLSRKSRGRKELLP